MPITVRATEGVFEPAAEHELFADLTASLLKHHQLTGNSFMTPNVIGEITTIPKGRTFSGGKPADIVTVEIKVPSFAFSEPAQKAGFVAEATDAVRRASNNRVPTNRIYVSLVYAVDGMWGIGGTAYSNAKLLEAVTNAA